MKNRITVLLLLIVLTSACTQTRATNNNFVKTAIDVGSQEQAFTDNPPTDQPIVIGGYTTKYTSRDISDTLFFITISKGGNADFSGIEQLQNTRSLRITLLDPMDVDFSPLRTLPNLNSLNLGGWVTAIPDLSDIPSLKILQINSASLTSLNGIEKITSLETLEITQNYVPLTDISAMRYLKNLKSFHFINGYLTIDFSVFADLPELEVIWLGGDGQVDLTGIGQAKTIEKLRLWSNVSKIVDERTVYKNIAEIGKMTGLRELYLDESISSVEFLAGNVNLERLELIADQERSDYWEVLLPLDVNPLGNLTKLKYLAIRGFELTNANVLENLPELENFSTRLYDGDH